MTDAATVVEALLDPEVRWVALVGPPGVGKSHLAAAAVEALPAGAFAVVRRVSLAEATTAAALADAIGDLPDDAALLVLDGVDGVPPTALEGVRASGARVLSTSHAPPFADVTTLEVRPLAVPTGDRLEGPAADLLLDRARRARPGLSPSEADAAVLAALVRELDGLPLAIELAAPRLAVMSPTALLHRVRSSRAVLRGATRSFDAAVQGAFAALEDSERSALGQLCVFVGGATIEAAEAVVDLSAHEGAPPVLDVLGVLRTRAMLTSEEGPDGEVRLGMLRSVRDFVARQTSPAEHVAARRRHATHFADAAEAIVADPRRLLCERAELVAVVERILGERPVTARVAEPALRVILALHPGHEAPAPRGWAPLVEAGIEATRDSGADPSLVARGLAARGSLRRALGEEAGALRDLVRARELGRRAGLPRVEGIATLEIARLLHDRGALEEAADHARAAISTLRGSPLEPEATEVLAAIARDRGAVDESRALLEGAALLADRFGDKARSTIDRALTELALDLDRHDEARRLLGRRDDHPGWDLLEAGLAHGVGDLGAALRLADLAAERARAAELRLVEASALAERALIRLREGALGEVPVLLRAARERTEGLPHRHAVIYEALSAHLVARVTPSAPRVPLGAAAQRDPIAAALAASGSIDAPRTGWDRRLRVLAAALGASPTRAAPPAGAWVVGAEGRSCRAPGGDVVDLERRRPLARIVHRLALQRRDHAGVALSSDDLLEAGWPGERILAAAGAHRVRVAVSTLRKLGLRDLLLTTEDGYTLDPRTPLVFE